MTGSIAFVFAACTTRSGPRFPPIRPAASGPPPHGPLGPPDRNGIRLPDGFTARRIATAGRRVQGTGYVWHRAPDGGATFPAGDGGWVYVSNSEVGDDAGGVGAIRFDADGAIASAYRILDGTNRNCAGGPTPWGTWLSCEEHSRGRVWECDPGGTNAAESRPAMGVFQHEAAAVDPDRERVYLTEDEGDGRLYRFTPAAYPSLTDGALEAMRITEDGPVEWVPVEDPSARRRSTRAQTRDATRFDGGEGAWFDVPTRTLFFTTKGDNRVWAYRPDDERIEVIYDRRTSPRGALSGVDNVTVSPAGHVLVAEDGGNMELVLLTKDGVAAPLLRVTGQDGSELTGPAFDPSGTRLYFSSQRAEGDGVTYEVTGPFGKPAA